VRKRPDTAAILVAAGVGKRLGKKGDKVFQKVAGKPLLFYSLHALQESRDVSRVVVVVQRVSVRRTKALVRRFGFKKVEAIVSGGRRRQDSVRNGLRFAGSADYVLVHDGARPFLSKDLISRTVDACVRTGAAVAALPVSDTVKKVVGNRVVRTVSRKGLWLAQTPQVFRRRLLEQAFERRTARLPATDDSAMVEKPGRRIAMVEGDSFNIKITYRADLLLAEALLRLRSRRRE
jgi:2-C-methyl-D-erythritol 4-phosphate cytidylyltransferase